LVPVNQPMPEITELPDHGVPWQPQMTVNMKCIGGTDAGVEVIFKTATDGGIKAVTGLIEAVRDRFNSSQHDGTVVPILRLEKSSHPRAQYGRTWIPVLTIVDWMPLSGPAPAPAPTSPSPTEQPRRRRLA